MALTTTFPVIIFVNVPAIHNEMVILQQRGPGGSDPYIFFCEKMDINFVKPLELELMPEDPP